MSQHHGLASYVWGALAATTGLGAALAALLAPVSSAGAAQKYLVPDGSRATAVHRLPLTDEDGQPINAADKLVMPFSQRTTCSGKCHNYDEIATGWHFNAPDPKVDPGRPGEPWILFDLKTGTQLPVSARNWPGTVRPMDVGLTPWGFTKAFGRHTPGGGYGEKFAEPKGLEDPKARWMVSGKLEVDCQGCHAGNADQDSSLWSSNIESENFRWAAMAASGIAYFKGDARTLPEMYDFLTADSGDDPKRNIPQTVYEAWRFNPKKEVFFDSVAKPGNDRCYYCHTNRPIGKDAPEKWEADEDVHLRAGLKCVDCHRNGNDHMMTRNYEGEKVPAPVSNLTCRGCHLGEQSAAAGTATMGGRLGAPVPQHIGLPTIHIENLACTTCHSGPYPGREATHLMTSRAHSLGIKAKEHREDALPFIQWPVFIKAASDGKITPHKVMWPAFWGRLKGDAVTPIAPDAVAKAAGIKDEVPLKAWKPMAAEQVGKILEALAPKKDEGEPVYVAGGRLHRRGADGKVTSVEHPAAKPYAWPLGHDVRPAKQALGARACTDCHGFDTPIFWATLTADSPAALGEPLVKVQHELLGKDSLELQAWAMSYMFRPMFKVVGFATAALIGAVLVLYLFLGLAALLRWAATKAPQGRG